MADQTLRRTDDLLTELIEQVETARSLPMSSSCVLPRERVLDLLDELREVVPAEVEDARRVLADRDTLLHDAHAEAAAVREHAAADAERTRTAAREHAEAVVAAAHDRAAELVREGQAVHDELVGADVVHRAAADAARELRHRADADAASIRTDAERYAADLRAQAEQYAAQLTAESEDYADRTLAALAATLSRSAATAEQGRAALAARREGAAAPPPAAEESELAELGRLSA
jgi:hypothetical protein